jgi:glycosyltransferase involved in cell wall biosynthesis
LATAGQPHTAALPHDAAGRPAPRDLPLLSCVLPCHNEGKNLAELLPLLAQTLDGCCRAWEIILVDDGSHEDSALVMVDWAGQPGFRLLQLSRNFGKEAALSAGLDQVRGEAVFILDADGQHPIAMLPEMLQKWEQGADVVYAVRRTRTDQSGLHRRLAGAFYSLVNWGSRVKVPADAGDFRLMDCRVVQALRALPERHRFMKGLYAWVGYPSVAMDYEPLPRLAGQSSYGLGGAFRLGATGLLAFSATPLRILGGLGVLLALAALLYGIWVVISYFVYGIAVPGYATLVTSMMFLSGVQLMAVGLLSEYVARIYDEVKRRPLYLVMRRSGQGLPPDQNNRPV